MKLPAAKPPSLQFQNAPNSNLPMEYALAARANPDDIMEMAENPQEKAALQREALARQYVIIVDRSGSMLTRDGNATRWDAAQAAVYQMIETIFHSDVDHSVPVYLFDHEVHYQGECSSIDQVRQIFSPDMAPRRGTTNLAAALDMAMEMYAGTKRPNYNVVPGTTFIVILDGSTDNDEAVKQVLYKFANPANGYVANHTQIAVSFVQIGDDPGATRFLKDLDDNLPGLDIVDCTKDDEVYKSGGIVKLLHDAIFD